jgi:hypothetical protein
LSPDAPAGAVAGDAPNLVDGRDTVDDQADSRLVERAHSGADGRLEDRLRRLLDQPPDLAVHREHLVERDPPGIAGVRAGRAADGPVDGQRAVGAGEADVRRTWLIRLAALVAQPARETLRDEAVQRRSDQRRRNAHVQ